jgi:hypothetical protein
MGDIMMDNTVKFYPKNAAENPDNVLEQAIGVYDDMIIIGWDKDGNLDCRSSLNLTHEQVLWLITKFQHKLMNGDFSDD